MALTPSAGVAGEPSPAIVRNPHVLSIDKRKRAVIGGVMDVSSFHESEVVLKIDSGEMVLTGQNLHISKLLLEDGQLHVEGQIDGVQYHTKTQHVTKGRWLQRLLKPS